MDGGRRARGRQSWRSIIRRPLPRRSSRSAADEIAERIRGRILIGELKPSVRLTLREMGAEFGSSATPARDAVQRLLAEGLAVQEGQKTVVVAPMTVGEFVDIMEIRIILEPRALELSIPRLTAEDFTEARQILRRMAKSHLPFAFSEMHRMFHMVLYRHSGRPRMLEAIERQYAHLARYLSAHWALEGVRAVLNEVEGEYELLSLVERRDIAAASAFLRRDLEDALVRVAQAIPA
jgi:DNA-binding GntR family transcriptional regulator